MGGDHKCPVCQATFTRPQHVARHMRSHTGDRPYKCQYCGDQFARSDLLSRHVNKCHSNERPLPGLSARRKGAAAASRATTSKQACDQCVQASLPCDGANPCSKCAARKYRCTYVKFHRQTAPAGPGHETRLPSANPSVPSTIGPDDPLLSQTLFRDDPFLLAPPPGNAPSSGSGAGNGVPQTMAETLFHSHSFAFPTLYPQSTSPSIGLGTGGAGGSFPGGGLGTRTGFTPLFEQRGGAGGWLAGWTDGDILPPLHSQQQPGVGPGLSVSSQSIHTGSAPMPPQTQQLQQQDAPSVAISMPYPGYLLPPMPAPSTLAATLAQAQSGSGDSTLGQTQLDQQQQQLNQQRLDHHHHMEHQERMLRHEQQQQQRGRVYAQQQASTGSISQQHSTHGSSQSMQGSHHNSHPHSHSTSRPGTSSSAGGASVHTGTRRSSTSTGPPLSQDGGGQYGSYSASGPYKAHSSNGPAQDYHAGGAREYYKNRDFRDGHPYGEDDDERFAFVDEDDRGQWSVTDNFSLVPERAGSASTSSSSSHRHPSTGYDDGLSDHGFSHTTEDRQGGEVHDAFGLMSLDDPAVLAGIAADGQPFFSDPNATHNQDMDTPMPTKRPGAPGGMQLLLPPTPAREQDTRELRDFWKQYMRTPLSGPAPDPTTASGSGHPLGGTGPRKRVASLPSVKTPIVEKDHLHANANLGAAAGQAGGAGGMSSMRTTLHRPEEDLRSYEAAVLARKAPTQLKLQARKKTHQQGGTGNSYVPSQQQQQQQQQRQQQRPTSASDTDAKMPLTSSLAHAFGVGSSAAPGSSASNAGGASGRSATRVAFAVDEADSPAPQSSRASSVSADGHGTGSDGDSSRPSFKRLPSQTLGPSAAKRAFLGFGDNDERVAGWGPGVGAGTAAISEAANKTANAVEIKQEGNVNLNGTGAAGSGMGTGVPSSNLSHPDRVVASLAERRRRRMSAPSGSLVLPDLHSLQPGTSQG